MKNFLIFICSFLIVFVAGFSFAEPYPGQCTVKVSSCAGKIATYTTTLLWTGLYQLPAFNPSTLTFQYDPNDPQNYEQGTTFYKAHTKCYWYQYYWDADLNSWHLQSTTTFSTAGYNLTGSPDDGSPSEPPVEGCSNPCEDKAGESAGTLTMPGLYSSTNACIDGCTATPSAGGEPGAPGPLSMSYKNESDEWETMGMYVFNGNQCQDGDGTSPPDPPESCGSFMDRCEAACRGADEDNSYCDETGRECSCDLAPPYPLVDDGNGPQPDQDQDGTGSGSDDDVDGDGTGNGGDGDVDGDGTGNGDDGDVDGDGTGNGGDNGSWYPDPGSPGGLGADDDVDGDGTGNCDDSDVDGDGLDNEVDPDADGDGLPNDEDLAPYGCDDVGEPDPYDPEDCVDDPATPEDECGGAGDCVDDPATPEDECGGDYGYEADPGTVDFGPLINAGRAVSGKFPITLAGDMRDMLNQFLAEGHAPSWDIPIGGHNMHIDLAVFDTFATVVRSMLSLLVVVGGTFLIIKMWSN